VPTLTLNCDDVLSKVIGKANDGQLRAWGHHPRIVASLDACRPSSIQCASTLDDAVNRHINKDSWIDLMTR